MPIKLTTVIINVSSITKRFLKSDSSIKRFFISIIGPNTKKPKIEPSGNRFKKLRAINASEVEHAEKINANSIIERRAPAALPLAVLKNSCGTAAFRRAVIKAPMMRNGPAAKNSVEVCITNAESFADIHCAAVRSPFAPETSPMPSAYPPGLLPSPLPVAR